MAPTKKIVRKSTKDARKSATTTGGVNKLHRYRPGTAALQEIRRYQKPSERQGLVRELKDLPKSNVSSLTPLELCRQQGRLALSVFLKTLSSLKYFHPKRDISIKPKDLQLARRIRGERH